MTATEVQRLERTLPDDDRHPYRSGAWHPQHVEWRDDEVEVLEGAIPDDLDGLYVRNTENPLHEAISAYHPFDGDGMIHAMRFGEGRAAYRNRFVRTVGLEAEQAAGASLWAGLAEDPRSAVRTDGRTARGAMKDASSTDVVVHGGEVLTSFWQCGDLYRLDPDTLDTRGTVAWDGWFPDEGVSAHTKVDPATGELIFFNYGKQAPYLHVGVVDRAGTLVHYTPVPLAGPRLPHDIAITEHHIVVNDLPLHWDEGLLERGVHAVRMHDAPSRFGILPRRGGPDDVRWFEADPTYVLHWTNAYEDGDEVVLEGFHQGSPSPRKPEIGDDMWMFRYLALDWMETRLHRWRFDLRTGRCTEERLRDGLSEFGIIDPRATGRPHRYVWAAQGKPGWFLFDGFVRHDTATGDDDVLRLPEGTYGSEVGVAPRPGGAEDDAWVVTFTTDEVAGTSECWVLDGRRISDGPVARLALPEQISSGTHAAWAGGAELGGRR